MKKTNHKAYFAIIGANLIFGINIPITKDVLQHFLDPYSLTFFRMAGAAVIFWLLSLFTKKEKVGLKDLVGIFFASMFGIFINQFSFITGLSMASPVDASIIVTSTPLMTMIVSFLFLKEPITTKKAGGVLLGASGAVFLVLAGSAGLEKVSFNSWGDLLCLTSCLSYAIYLTAFRWVIDRYSPITLMKWMFLFASIMSSPFCLTHVAAVEFSQLPLSAYLETAYIVVGATFFTYLLIPIGQKGLRPTVLTMFNYLQPLVATLIAVLMGMDRLGGDKAIAAVLIFSGVFLTIKSKSKAQLDLEKK